MTVKELVFKLNQLPQNLEVCIEDAEIDDWSDIKKVSVEEGHDNKSYVIISSYPEN